MTGALRIGFPGGYFGGRPGGNPINRRFPEGILGGSLRYGTGDVGDDGGPGDGGDPGAGDGSGDGVGTGGQGGVGTGGGGAGTGSGDSSGGPGGDMGGVAGGDAGASSTGATGIGGNAGPAGSDPGTPDGDPPSSNIFGYTPPTTYNPYALGTPLSQEPVSAVSPDLRAAILKAWGELPFGERVANFAKAANPLSNPFGPAPFGMPGRVASTIASLAMMGVPVLGAGPAVGMGMRGALGMAQGDVSNVSVATGATPGDVSGVMGDVSASNAADSAAGASRGGGGADVPVETPFGGGDALAANDPMRTAGARRSSSPWDRSGVSTSGGGGFSLGGANGSGALDRQRRGGFSLGGV